MIEYKDNIIKIINLEKKNMKNAQTMFAKGLKKFTIIGLVIGFLLAPLSQANAQSYSSYNGAYGDDVLLVSVAIIASPDTSCPGEPANLSWSSTDATSISINQGIGNVSPYGERTVSPTKTTTYTITGTNSTGGFGSASATVYVKSSCSGTPPPPPSNDDVTVNITADDTSISYDDSTTIRWTSDNANSCTASGGSNNWSGSKNTSGSFNTGDLTSDKTYSISCSNSSDSASDSVTINVGDDDDNNNNDEEPDVTTRSATSIEETSAVLRGEVDANGASTDVWFEYGRDRDDLDEETRDESVGSRDNEDFDIRISGLRRNTTYYFRAVAENSEGEDKGSILSFRTDDDDDNDDSDFSNLSAVTTPATFIGNTSAQLNSLILTSDDDANAWFEWGPSLNLGNRTSQSNIRSNQSVIHTSTLTGLVPGVTYYFRAVAEDGDRRNIGSILNFTTSRSTTIFTPPTVVRNTTTVINNGTGINSLVMLTIDGGSEFITNNERREYHVTWKNISSQILKDVVVRVILPRTMSFEAASKGSFSNNENTLSYEVETLRPGDDGELSLVAFTGNDLQEGELVVVVANLVYTTPSNVQGDALAYATHQAYIGGSVLGANAFLAGFLPDSLFGWLLLLILLLILILLGKYLLDQPERNRVIYMPPHGDNKPL